jgi:uncharacterized membrane protein
MEKVGKVFEILYLVIAVVFAYEAFNIWQSGGENLYLYIIFIVLAIFMFFFRRKTRIRREEYFNQKK